MTTIFAIPTSAQQTLIVQMCRRYFLQCEQLMYSSHQRELGKNEFLQVFAIYVSTD